MHIELSIEHYQQLAGQLAGSVSRLQESFADEAAGRVRDWDDAKRDFAQRYETPASVGQRPTSP